MVEIEKELVKLIGEYPNELKSGMATLGYNGELTPGNLVLAQYASKGEFGTYLDNYAGALSATGKKPKIDFTKILNTAVGVVTAVKGANDFIRANKANSSANNQPNDPVIVQTKTNNAEADNKKLFGLPRGLAILGIVLVVVIIGFVAVLIVKKSK